MLTHDIMMTSNSSSIVFIHSPSLAVRAAATYSASMLESATELCLLLRHAIAPPANVKTIPDVDREVSISPPNLNPSNHLEVVHGDIH